MGRGTPRGKFLSLRRHDPDQVKRVSAGLELEGSGLSALSWGSPRTEASVDLGSFKSNGRLFLAPLPLGTALLAASWFHNAS